MKTLLGFALLAGATTWSFEKDEIGKEPAGFDSAVSRKLTPGKWVVTRDGDNKVLAQTDPDRTNGRFAMAVVKDSSYKDLVLSVRAKPVSGEVDQAAGLVWRYQDADNYYIARSNALESNVRLYRVVNGNRIQFAGKDEVAIKTGEWHALKIEQRGSTIKVYFNDSKLFDAEDRIFEEAGRIGVWTKADSITHFDDLAAEELK